MTLSRRSEASNQFPTRYIKDLPHSCLFDAANSLRTKRDLCVDSLHTGGVTGSIPVAPTIEIKHLARISETSVLNAFKNRDICKKALAYVSKKDGYEYLNTRLKEVWYPKGAKIGRPITPRTVRREINSIQHIFSVTKEEWGYENLVNPFEGIKIKGSTHRRKRRLRDGELEQLEDACKDCRGLNKFYVPLAIYLAIDTGMRLQEIFNLTWFDIDSKRRRIEIKKSKTDHISDTAGRTIVLPVFICMHSIQRQIVLRRAHRLDL